ncbi:alpha/beta hydrolase [Actinacidiphila alni]|uniref:alpha/beta hydrolase n=1 Tax=Actinacidiphila alni TaxID=380248 RepID=UPI003455A70A
MRQPLVPPVPSAGSAGSASAGEPLHRTVLTPDGVRLHVVEQGSGPMVLLLHGFPESWYSWRHQLPALAAAGYRAVAPDIRGYGRSSAPSDVRAYGLRALAADSAAVVRALGAESAVVVGHDWGANIAAVSALLHPGVFRAVGLLSVPYAPPGGPRPSDVFAAMGGDQEFYVSYFQRPGRAEAETEPDVRGWLAGFYAALSADTMPGPDAPDPHFVGPGGTLRDRFPATRPGWLTEADLDHCAAEFERTGFTGALNRYRAMDHDWSDLAPLNGAPILQPALFLGGAEDASTTWLADAIAAFPTTLPALTATHLLPSTGHWLQQERPTEVTTHLTKWLTTLDV